MVLGKLFGFKPCHASVLHALVTPVLPNGVPFSCVCLQMCTFFVCVSNCVPFSCVCPTLHLFVCVCNCVPFSCVSNCVPFSLVSHCVPLSNFCVPFSCVRFFSLLPAPCFLCAPPPSGGNPLDGERRERKSCLRMAQARM